MLAQLQFKAFHLQPTRQQFLFEALLGLLGLWVNVLHEAFKGLLGGCIHSIDA